MRKLFRYYKHIIVFLFLLSLLPFSVYAPVPTLNPDLQVQTGAEGLNFAIPTLGGLLTFAIRGFFVIAGLAALFYMLLGAFAWVTSGGDKDAVTAAQQKIQAAVVGVIIIVAVLAVIWTLESVVFGGKICFGLSCPVTIPSLIK